MRWRLNPLDVCVRPRAWTKTRCYPRMMAIWWHWRRSSWRWIIICRNGSGGATRKRVRNCRGGKVHEDSSRNFGDSAGDWPAGGQCVREPPKPDGGQTGSSQCGVVAGGRGAATACGPDSEPGGNCEGICGTGASCLRRNCPGAVCTTQCENSGRQDCGQPTARLGSGTIASCG